MLLYAFRPIVFIRKIAIFFLLIIICLLFSDNDNSILTGSIAGIVMIFLYITAEMLFFKLNIYEDRIEKKSLWGKYRLIYFSDVKKIDMLKELDIYPFNPKDIYIQDSSTEIYFRPIWLGDRKLGEEALKTILDKINTNVLIGEASNARKIKYTRLMLLKVKIITLILFLFIYIFAN